ncbi:MAG TPA: Os1348 family NHLP clan protein, partial [Anaerolineales bacterium]|nr:Os1348 family NHLP clan protein [Anaerolineales bacterium]
DRMHRLIGRALVDRQFRERLLKRPAEAIRDLPFTGPERSLVESLRASSLEEFSRQLDEMLEQSHARRTS